MTALADFRSSHEGADIVVCGCGQSLRDLAGPEHLVTIGVNDVGRLFDPTYLVVVNPRSQFKGDRFKFVEQSNARALFTQLDLGRVRPPIVRFKLGQYGGTGASEGNTLHYAQNSPYVAVCLAALMGARRIGLIGVDLTDDHFFAATGRHSLSSRLREIDMQYGRLAAALAQRGVELVNLSAISRLTSLPRARIEDDGGWSRLAPPQRPVAVPAAPPVSSLGRNAMKVSIEKRASGVVGQLLDALAASVTRLGHHVVRDPRATANDPRVVSIVWNGRGYSTRGPTLYCEHGWLPRSDYQISPVGINAGSHLAPYAWDGTPLTQAEDAALDVHLESIKTASFAGYYQYMQATKETPPGLPTEFLLVPLQIESDTNITRHAPAHLRTMQKLIDYVAKLDPPWPVIFKQHPADARTSNRHLKLRLRRRQDLLWPQSRGNIHQMLKSGACRGIVTINSNVAHDGLLWDVPAIVLGRNIWPASGDHRPFLTAIPRDWGALAASVTDPQSIACRRAYAHFLMTNQWSLADARDPPKVASLLARARGRVAPKAVSAPPRPLAVARVRKGPMINVVAENRGWLFESWKQQLAATKLAGFEIVASNRPLREADAWIFIRTREAGATPDPARTVVQIHDLGEAEQYRPGGQRADVARCAALALTHGSQRSLLEAAGIDLAARRWILQPVGWSGKAAIEAPENDIPVVAWIGRPAKSGDERFAHFLEAASRMKARARIVLAGERLEDAQAQLRRSGVDCRLWGASACPLSRSAEWIARLDAVVIGGHADSGPWPLFDALHAGAAVIAPPVGWANELLADGTCGRVASDADSMADALEEILGAHAQWRERRASSRERVASYGMSAWAEANLALAAELARPAVRQAA